MPLTYDPAWLPAVEPILPILAARPIPKVHDIQTRRENVDVLFGFFNSRLSMPEGIVQDEFTITSSDGASITVLHTRLATQLGQGPTSAIVHAHGGGYILGNVQLFAKNIANLVVRHGVPTFSVNYRKAPEHPHPAPIEDFYAALTYLQAHASDFNIDPARVAVMGESAGGGLATGAALMARDRGLSPPLAKQVLIYPMLDDRNLEPIPGIEPLASWNCEANITAWTALLGADKVGSKADDAVSPYAAPARAKSLAGLPPTYIDVGDCDIFKAENLEYVTRLCKENVAVEFHLYPGVPHAFEGTAPDLWITKTAKDNRVRALMAF